MNPRIPLMFKTLGTEAALVLGLLVAVVMFWLLVMGGAVLLFHLS